MDFNAAELTQAQSMRAVKLVAFLFFAVSSGLLIVSLAHSGKTKLGLDGSIQTFGAYENMTTRHL